MKRLCLGKSINTYEQNHVSSIRPIKINFARMKNLILIIYSIFSFNSYSQITLKQLPKVTADDFQTNSCPIDSTAKAQIIFDIGSIYFWDKNDRIEHVFEKTTRIQILNKAGFEYATIGIPFYTDNFGQEEILDFTALSYNFEDGKIVCETIDKNDIYEDDINQHWKFKKYAFTKVKVGTIIEYTFKISSPYNVHLRTWYFQHEIPVLKSKFKFSACPFYNYIVLSKGFIEYDFDTVYSEPFGFTLAGKDYQTIVYELELSNVPAFKDESFVPSEDEYKMKMKFQLEHYFGYYGRNFELMTTWQLLIDELLDEQKSFGGYIKSERKDIKNILSTLSLNGKTDHEKVIEILKYVNNGYFWNNQYGVLTSQSKKEFIESKTGNVADMNLFLYSLLKEAKIESSPILISTRSFGKVYYQYPFVNLFNYVAVMIKVETGSFYIDATDPLLPLGLLPKDCINEYGLLVRKIKNGDNAQFTSLIPSKVDISKQNYSFNLNLLDNTIEAITQIKLDGYKAFDFRRSIKKNGVESIYDELIGQSQTEINDIVVEKLDSVDVPLVLNYTTRTNINQIGNKIFVTPFPANSFKESKLIQKNRIFPVDFGNLLEEQLYMTISIPDDYEIAYLPENKSFKNAPLILEYSYTVQRIETKIQIMVKIIRGKTKYEPSDYKELKAFYDMIVKDLNENLVFKKI